MTISILINPELVIFNSFIKYAYTLLESFVLKFQNIYGEKYIFHNVHNLIHLADVQRYGALDVFSAFRFENYMSKLKKMIKKINKLLQQLSRRYFELYNLSISHICASNESDEYIYFLFFYFYLSIYILKVL